jgi:hypothetical protein
MVKNLCVAVCAGLLALPAWSQTEPVAAGGERAPAAVAAPQADGDVAGNPADTVLVVGQRPGPGLWKVSKGDHVLWVFGTYSPLPKKMEWRSHQVETILTQSQEYLSAPVAKMDVGFFRSLTLLPQLVGVKKSPDGAQLRDLVPADLYARWLVLKRKYIGDDDGIERERPIFVADALFSKAMKQAGLTNSREVQGAIENIVKKNKIKVTPVEVKLALDDPSRAIKDFKRSSLDDVACFSKTIERLETDLDAMRVRANAWAKGDLEGIRKLGFTDQGQVCASAMTDSAFAKAQPEFGSMHARMQEKWLAAAEKSLETNKSTFAVLQLRDLLDPKGYVAALQAKGYLVEQPE